jgi:predicted SprT family Zn-dependent metalloprotease
VNENQVFLEGGTVKTSTALVTLVNGEAYDSLPELGPFTPELHRKMQVAVDHFKALIGVRSDAHLTFARKANSAGHFAPNRYVGRDGASIASHEINLNPDHFVNETDQEVASTLAHKLVHLWEHKNGSAPRGAYHGKVWAEKMKSIGLMPSSTGAPGGKETGNRVSHYILTDGPFTKSFAALQATGWRLDLESAPRPGSSTRGLSSKTKFTCPECGQNAWGKPRLEVWCKSCSLALEQPVEMIAALKEVGG